jgi:WD40 repeat protein
VNALTVEATSQTPAREARRIDWSLLLGYDFFISYHRTSSENYARSLFYALEAEGFGCFLDQEDSEGGVRLRDALPRALRRSRVLLIIAEPGVLESDYIGQEILDYLSGGRQDIHPINIDGFLTADRALPAPFEILSEFTWTDETANALRFGDPRPEVITSIRKSATRLRVRTLSRILTALSVAVLAVAATIALWQRFEAVGQRDEAVRQQELATARLLATESELVRSSANTTIELSALLARESLQITPTVQGRQALYRALELLPRSPLQDFNVTPSEWVEKPGYLDTYFSPDGRFLAVTRSKPSTDRLEKQQLQMAIWQIAEATLVATSTLPEGIAEPIWGGDTFYMPSASGEVHRWHAPTGAELPAFKLAGLGRIISNDENWGRVVWTGEYSHELLGWHSKEIEERGPLMVSDPESGTTLEIPIEYTIKAAWLGADFDMLHVLWGHRDTTYYGAFNPSDGTMRESRKIDGGATFVRAAHRAIAFVNRFFHIYDGAWSRTESLSIFSSFFTHIEPVHVHHLAPIRDATIPGDGTVVASHSKDNRIRVSELGTGGALIDLAHPEIIDLLVLSYDGRRLAFADELNDVHVWDTRLNRQISSIGVGEEIADLAFLAELDAISVVTESGRVRIWQSVAGAAVADIQDPAVSINFTSNIVSSPSGSHLAFLGASSSEPPDLYLFELSSKTLRRLAHAGDATQAVFSEDARTLITVGSEFFRGGSGGSRTVGDYNVRVFDLQTYQMIGQVETPSGGSAFLAPGGEYAVQTRPSNGEADGEDDRARVVGIALPAGTQQWSIEVGDSEPKVRFAGEVVVVTHGSLITTVDLHSGAILGSWAAHRDGTIATNSNPPTIAFLTADSSQVIISLSDGVPRHTLPVTESVTELALSPDGSRIIVEQNSSLVSVWELPGLNFVHDTTIGHLAYWELGPRGRYVNLHKRQSKLWDPDLQGFLRFPFDSAPSDIAIHPDGTHIAVKDKGLRNP